ncbi:LCP family protein [Catellatospora tritici]|uniref:LCP family protein n=1 Tax=Catellatospora tritici TaxID=2851566 RepID=UPI0020C3DEEC|nr:LCP family protein [Catellatospora tritici]
MARSTRLLLIIGVVLVLLGGGAYAGVSLLRAHVDDAIPQADLFGPSDAPTPSAPGSPSPSPSPTPPAGADIKGPLNILIVGVDTREAQKSWPIHGDAVMILHVNADLSSGYLTSLPRDLVVRVPAFKPSNYGGTAHTKLTHAMTFGGRVPGTGRFDMAQGFQLMAKAVSGYTGIARFDAGAVITFTGYRDLIDAMGGVDIYVDQKVVSIHRQPDGKLRPPCRGCDHGYSGPRATYNVGVMHMRGWQALDYGRQRYTTGSEYTRQRHQRQLIKAMAAKAFSGDLLTSPGRLEAILQALGKTIVFDGRGHTPSAWAYALRKLTPANITLVGLPGHGVYSGGKYQGEALDSVQSTYFAALRKDQLAGWVKTHPKLVNVDPRA